MLKEYFDDILNINPSFASFLGDRTKDDKVEVSISPSYKKQFKQILHKYKKEIQLYKPLTQEEIIDINVLKYIIDIELRYMTQPYELMPISSFNNFIKEFTFMDETMYPRNTEKQMSRHKCYLEYINQAQRNLIIGLKKGYTIPSIICFKLIEDIQKFIDSKGYMINKEIERFFEDEYRPQILNFLRFLKTIYYPKCRKSIGLYDLPNGIEMYTIYLKQSTTLDLTPKQIHDFGKQEVSRISKEFMLLKSHFYPNDNSMNVTEFINKMKDNPEYYVNDSDEIIKLYKQKQKDLRSTIIKDMFYDYVRPYEIHKVPKMLETSSAGAFYYPGSSTRPGKFYINVRDPKENPLYSIETLTIHEGEPGHHYQFQYMLDKNIPLHRIYSCDNDAFAEGWALYTESLSQSSNPLFKFGRLTYEMFRAVRCVVDTGIHYYGWSYDKAFNYMKKYIAMKESELESELYRYISMPGQATAYKIGERFFLELRKRFLSKYPNKTIKDYHKFVLENGILPIQVLESIL